MRRKPHSNRYKRLRVIAQIMSNATDTQNVLGGKKVRVGLWVPDMIDKDLVVKNPRAKKFRNKYKHHYVETVRIQPFWNYGGARRLYKDMKRGAFGGSLRQLEARVTEALSGRE